MKSRSPALLRMTIQKTRNSSSRDSSSKRKARLKTGCLHGRAALAGLSGIVIAAGGFVRMAAQAGAQPKTAVQAYKNIQVLKDIPADQLIPSMQFISASLGVECDFCHVEHAFEKDDKRPKQTARKMMQMMITINQENFDSHKEVTCYSCHRGQAKPVGIPPVATEASLSAPPTPEAKALAEDANSKAAVDAVLNKYVTALGGAAAIEKVTSRIEKGSAEVGGKQFAIDIYARAPDNRVSVMHFPNGESVTAYNGQVGWLSVPGRPTHWMSGPEAEAASLDANLFLPVQMKKIFGEFKLGTPEKIDGHDTTQVLGLRDGKPPVKFYFDSQSGLLVRMVRYAETALGLNPSQVDYADYRDSGGVKIPYRWTLSRPNGRFTIQVDQVQQNVKIDTARFTAPAQDAAAAAQSSSAH
jgi:photosynthetic reaction center cytochrome c subunit